MLRFFLIIVATIFDNFENGTHKVDFGSKMGSFRNNTFLTFLKNLKTILNIFSGNLIRKSQLGLKITYKIPSLDKVWSKPTNFWSSCNFSLPSTGRIAIFSSQCIWLLVLCVAKDLWWDGSFLIMRCMYGWTHCRRRFRWKRLFAGALYRCVTPVTCRGFSMECPVK